MSTVLFNSVSHPVEQLDPPCNSPIYLIANQATVSYIQEYSDLEDLGLNDPTSGVRLIYSEDVRWRRRSCSSTSKLQDEIDKAGRVLK